MPVGSKGLALDGAYRCGVDGVPGFIEAGAPTDDQLDALRHTIMARLMESLSRRARQPLCAFDIGTDISRHARPRARRLGAGDLRLAGGQPLNAQVLRPALPGHLRRRASGWRRWRT